MSKPADNYFKGRGSQIKTSNRFEKFYFEKSEPEAIDDYTEGNPNTQLYFETPKKIISKNDSPDLSWDHSINPYQGCEHGCTYCYARNSHEFWGFNAGLDFESRIVVKKEAPELLERQLLQKSWKPSVIMLSGNTDCYQPLEKKFELTRRILEMLVKYQNPVGIITKNALILRDLDIISELAKDGLIHVAISINSMDEELRRKLEPRTSSYAKRLNAISKLTDAGVPVMAMVAPIIPGLNHHDIPKVIKAVAEAGALKASYTTVRLNGQVGLIFKDWVEKNYPNRFEKIWHQIESLHGGNVNDSQFGRRMRGDGKISDSIKQLFDVSVRKFMPEVKLPEFDYNRFRKGGNYNLF